MATFSFLSTVTYTRSGNSTNFFDNANFTNGAGTLDSGDATFDVGDPVAGGTFAGTVDFAGSTFVVIQTGADDWTIYSPLDAAATEAALPDKIVEGSQQTASFSCFLPGTLIATPHGEVAVETLSVGDEITTDCGRVARVKWLGRQTAMTRFGPAERLMPVRFAAGSLGGGLPHADLTVTADHAMLVEGVLCNAGALINGTTITRVPLAEMGERFTVYHIETEAHEIILANGAPAETFIDNVSRRVFDNFAEFEALYGEVPEMEELPLPRAMSARQVPAGLRRKLGIDRAA
ncbi:Hint domain-containing protein [Seohaeicola saemankumensis]|nr:Hint domain-containing protein [Seohaeicola saemankumensis]MCA0870132.1 Hint domain-containing protein [Seohaeicola saemankumensis]